MGAMCENQYEHREHYHSIPFVIQTKDLTPTQIDLSS